MLCTDMTLCSVHNMLCSVSFWLRHCSPCLLLEIRRVNEEYFKCCTTIIDLSTLLPNICEYVAFFLFSVSSNVHFFRDLQIPTMDSER